MDAGFAQVVSSTLGAITSVIVAVIAGYFTVRAAQVKAGEKETPQQIQSFKPAISWPTWVIYALICGALSMPLGFALAYTGNSLSGVSSDMLFGDSLDPALVSGVLGFVSFMLGAWTGNMKLGTGNMLILFFIVGIFSSPVAYSLAYTGNWLSGVSDEMLFPDSLDSLIVGGIMCAICFVVGTFIGSRFQKKAAA